MKEYCRCQKTPKPSEVWCYDCGKEIFRTWVECSLCHAEVNSWYMVDPDYVLCQDCKEEEEYTSEDRGEVW